MLAARVLETSTTTGTGAYALDGAPAGLRSVASSFANGAMLYYYAVMGAEWEEGIGTLATGSPNTIARTTVLDSTSGGGAVNWGAGTKTIFVSLPYRTIKSLVDVSAPTGVLVRTGTHVYSAKAEGAGGGLNADRVDGVDIDGIVRNLASARGLSVAASTPGSPTADDLWIDTTNHLIKKYNGSTFDTILNPTRNLGGWPQQIQDTAANILASTPTAGKIGLATDSGQLWRANGSGWSLATSKFSGTANSWFVFLGEVVVQGVWDDNGGAGYDLSAGGTNVTFTLPYTLPTGVVGVTLQTRAHGGVTGDLLGSTSAGHYSATTSAVSARWEDQSGTTQNVELGVIVWGH